MFGFSLLYTNISHCKLKSEMKRLINFIFFFNGREEDLFGVTRNGAIWTNDQQKYILTFNKTSLKLAINYLLDKC